MHTQIDTIKRNMRNLKQKSRELDKENVYLKLKLNNLTHDKKEWLKMINHIKSPFLCEAYIIQLEAQKAKLKPNFISKTP